MSGKTNYCAECGGKLTSNAKYCSACGTKRGETKSAESSSSSDGHTTIVPGCCQHCGRYTGGDYGGRGDTYCSCREDAMSSDEREKYNRWIQGMERGGGGGYHGGGYGGRD